MANIASLAIQLTANTRPFDTAMQKSSKQLAYFQKSAAATAAGTAVGFLGIGSAAAAFSSAVSAASQVWDRFVQSFEDLEGLQDLANQLDASVSKLNALKAVANKTGTSFGVVEGGMQKMIVKIGEAVEGSTEAQMAFRRLGLDADKLIDMDTVDAFAAVSNAINKLPSASQRAAASAAVFGKGWKELSEVLGEGGEAIAKASARMEQLGLTITEADAKAVDSANSAWRELRTEIGARFDKAAAGAASSVELVANALKASIDPTMAAIRATSKLATVYEQLKNSIAGQAIGNAIAGSDVLQFMLKGAPNTPQPKDPVGEKAKRDREVAEGFKNAMEKLSKQGKEAQDVFEATRNPLEKYNAELEKLNTLLDAGAISQDTFNRAAKQAEANMRSESDALLAKSDLVKKLKELDEKKKFDVGNFTQTTIGGLRNTIGNAMRGTDLASMQASGVSDLGRQQRVQDPQLATTNKYLQQIAKNTENQAAVAA